MFKHKIVGECLTYLNDVSRNSWYQQRINTLSPGKKIFEVGCGAGLLAAYVLESGAEHYYGIDIKPERVAFTAEVLDRLGYHGRHTIWCADIRNIDALSLPRGIDLVLCEQTGHQMQSNFTIRQSWQNLHLVYPEAIFLPDTWSIDAHIYRGDLDITTKKHLPDLLLHDPSLPSNYARVLDSMDNVRPEKILPQILTVSVTDPHAPLEFTIDLRDYESATILLVDNIRFRKEICYSSSALCDWPVPAGIVITDAGSNVRFYWDTEQRRPNFIRGFWNWYKI